MPRFNRRRPLRKVYCRISWQRNGRKPIRLQYLRLSSENRLQQVKPEISYMNTHHKHVLNIIFLSSLSFATSCEISDDESEIYCTCREGYTGPHCQSCASGYYGHPEVEGEFCRPCECSGNIDTNDLDACDSRTGECIQCMNNTAGTACNLCAPGFYGDAVTLKDCQSNRFDEFLMNTLLWF